MHFHHAVLENNLAEITVAYESGWIRLTEKFYSKTEWPEAEVIAPLVNDGAFQSLFQGASLWPYHRPYFSDPVSRIVLPSCLLPATARHRRPLPLVRKQLRAV